ncbi:MAG: hypothetical protein P8163_15265 [Candidatus Thiodiazotropha sp.]
MFDYDENRFDGYAHLLGESRYSVNGTLALHHHKRTLHAVQLIFLG